MFTGARTCRNCGELMYLCLFPILICISAKNIFLLAFDTEVMQS